MSIYAPNILLMGPPGTGKSHSLATLVKAGLEVFIIATEAGAVDTTLKAMEELHLPLDRLHWRYVLPENEGWKTLQDSLMTSHNMTFQGIADMKQGIARQRMTQTQRFVETLMDFKCDRTQKSYGDPSSWDTSRALCVDSLSGLNWMLKTNHVGLKSAMHMGEWGVVRGNQEHVIKELQALRCWFILTAHISRTEDQATQTTLQKAKAITSSYSDDIGKEFGEVILTKRDGTAFLWSNQENFADVKHRLLPMGQKLPPDFTQLVGLFNAHAKRQQIEQPSAGATVVAA